MAVKDKATHYRVTGAAVVLKLASKGERYLYRNAVVAASSFDEDSIKRAVSNKLIEPVEIAVEKPEEPDEGVYKGVSVKDLKAEIDKRNADREDTAKVVPAEPGNRPEIVAALIADDNKQ